MATAHIGQRRLQPVTSTVAQLVGSAGLDDNEIMGAWTGIIDGKKEQALVVTSRGVMLFLEAGTRELSWEMITLVDPARINEHELLLYNTGSGEAFANLVSKGMTAQGLTHESAGIERDYSQQVPKWRRARNRRMIEELRQTAGKYDDALTGRRFALLSLIGTEDWEDYASLAIRGMLLESTTDVEERLESIEGLLRDIRDLLTLTTQKERDLHEGP